MRARYLLLASLPLGLLVADVVGCSSVGSGELGELEGIVDDGAVTNIGEDTGVPPEEDTGTPTEEDTGTPTEEDTAIPSGDTGSTTPKDTGSTTPKDTGTTAPDTSVTDTAKPDTGTVVTDTGSTTGDWPAAYASLEQQILVETNRRRALGASCGTKGSFGPAPALVMQSQLQWAARKHSKDMATNNYFSHTNLAGKSPFDRMRAEGYRGGTMGENIAAGNGTAAATMDQWMKSDGHCANIMNKSYTQLGVGYWYSATSTYRHYWTQNFGAGG
jgi:uncharacterized protein YkwD